MKTRCERWKCKNKAKTWCREWKLCNKCYRFFWKAWEVEHGSHLFLELLRSWFGHKRIRRNAKKEIRRYIKDIKSPERKQVLENKKHER